MDEDIFKKVMAGWFNEIDNEPVDRLVDTISNLDVESMNDYGDEASDITIDISLSSLKQHEKEAYECIIHQDADVEDVIESLTSDVLDHEYDIDYWVFEHIVDVRFVNPPESMFVSPSSDFSAKVGKMVAVRGRVDSSTRPLMTFSSVVYECQRCGTHKTVPQDPYATDLRELRECGGCEREGPFAIVKDADETDYVPWQFARVEEQLSASSSKDSPESINVYMLGRNNVDGGIRRGEMVEVVGIVDADAENQPIEPELKVSSVESLEDHSMDLEVTEGDREEIEALVNDNTIEEIAAEHVAPHIWGEQLAKTGVLIMAIGHGMDGDRQMHGMLLGEPDTGKSQIVQYINLLVPQSRFANASGASKVGMIASADREEIAGESRWVVKAGELALASGGLLCLDELDKVDFAPSDLNEALSQQEVRVSKAGISTVVRTDCSLLTAANTIGDRLDPEAPLADQVHFDPSLVSRFDVILPFVDERSEARTEGIASSTKDRYMSGGGVGADSRELITKWLYLVRQQPAPEMTEEAGDYIADKFVSLRADARGASIEIGPRRQDSMYRLATAHARSRFSETVEREDAEWAFKFIGRMLKRWGYNPEGGALETKPNSENAGQQATATDGGVNTDGEESDDDGVSEEELERQLERLQDEDDEDVASIALTAQNMDMDAETYITTGQLSMDVIGAVEYVFEHPEEFL